LRYLFGFLTGALLGFGLALLVAQSIKALFPAEHMAYGLAGVLIAFVAMPTLGILLAFKFGRRKKTD
jgi:hypothetical protein